MDEQEASRPLTPERLAEYNGPKLGKHMRRELKEQAALLYEKVMLFRLLDPDFEETLEQMGAMEFLDRYTEQLRRQQEETYTRVEQRFEQRARSQSGANEA